MDDDRRSAERRNDPNVWSAGHRKQVQTVYAMVVGGVIVLFGLVILSWAIMQEGDPNLIALGVGSGVCLIGLVASMPKTFMPILSYVLKRLPILRKVANGDIKVDASELNLPAIVPEKDDEA